MTTETKTQGRRRADTGILAFAPGDFGLIEGRWYCRTPNGLEGCLANHDVQEHEDGTITVAPSILVSFTYGEAHELKQWHGWLIRGVWTSA